MATISSGVATLDVPVQLDRLTFNGRVLILDQTLTTSTATINGGDIGGPGGLVVLGDLELTSGQVNNTLQGPDGFRVEGQVIKTGFGRAVLTPFGSTGDYEIVVRQGTFAFGNGGLGTREGAVTVTSPEFARVAVRDLTRLSDDLHLNNARGFAGQGGLLASGFRGFVSGDIFLGGEGAIIGVNQQLTISGAIHGGDLTLVRGGFTDLQSAGNTYTGVTRLGTGASLQLSGDGEVGATSAFEIGHSSRLLINNEDVANSDRLPDGAPISLKGGGLAMTSFSPAGPVVERVGELSLETGRSNIEWNRRQSWRFASLDRAPQATIDFRNRAGTPSADNAVRFDQAPALTNNILGGWATASNDFATYDETLGVVPLGSRVARPTSLADAGPLDHVLQTGFPTLTKAATVATARLRTGGFVELGGNQLRLTQGGLIITGGSAGSLTGGTLTAGDGAAPADLYVYGATGSSSRDEYTIGASIANNPDGGEVSLVLTPTGRLELSGANSYTGSTVVQSGRIRFTAEQALPSGGGFVVEGGNVVLDYTPTETKRLSRLVVDGNASLVAFSLPGQITQSAIEIDADTYELRSGSVRVSLSGDGPVRKTGPGVVELGYNSPGLTGDIVIEEGTLIAGQRSVAVVPKPLGGGTTRILPGGTLVNSAVATGGEGFMRLDADLDLAGGDVALGFSIRTGRWDFVGPIRVSERSRLLLFDAFGDDVPTNGAGEPIPAEVNLTQRVVFDDGAGLSVVGKGTVRLPQSARLSGDATLDLEGSRVELGQSLVVDAPSTLRLTGRGELPLPIIPTTATSEALTLEIAPEAEIQISATQGRAPRYLGANTLVVQGVARGNADFLNGGTLSGSGVIEGSVGNISGVVAPGESIGALEINNFRQDGLGRLELELLGGDAGLADQLRVLTARINGEFVVSLLDGAKVRGGDTFDLVVGQTIEDLGLTLTTNGFVGSLSLIDLTSGPDAGMQALRLTVAVPEPNSVAVMAGFALVLTASTRRRS